MNRYHLIAAELYGYSYAHYADKLDIGNERFRTYMPDDARTLEKAVKESWPLSKLARKLEVDEAECAKLLEAYAEAVQIVDGSDPAESFRRGVRTSIKNAVEQGLQTEHDIEQLVVQICYRAADLAFNLDQEGTRLSRYSAALREEKNDDAA